MPSHIVTLLVTELLVLGRYLLCRYDLGKSRRRIRQQMTRTGNNLQDMNPCDASGSYYLM